MRILHMAYRTEECYIGWLRRLRRFHSKKRMDEIDKEDLKAFFE